MKIGSYRPVAAPANRLRLIVPPMFLLLAAVNTAPVIAATCPDTLVCNMEALSIIRDSTKAYSDCWGFAANGQEYAITGYRTGTIFTRVTDPRNPVEVGFITGPNSIWRDIKTFGTHAYIVTEGTGSGSGLQIVDISDPENPFLANTYNATFTTAHNLYIDTAAARCYVVGTGSGMHILDLSADPANPAWLGSWNNDYIHDLFVLNDTAYVSPIYSGTLKILDVSNPASISVLASHFYSGASNHNAWLLQDHRFLLTSDEANRGHVRCWDISDFKNITEVSKYQIPGFSFSAHNVLVKGTIAYIAYYANGLRLVDFADPYNPVEIGYYDTYPPYTSGTYAGNWGNYPFLPSGTLIASDQLFGIHLLRFKDFTGVAEGTTEMAGHPLRLVPGPNPFNPATMISFTLPGRNDVTLSIYAPSGRLVRNLLSGTLPGGDHSVRWNGLDDGGAAAASGVYFTRLTAGSASATAKLNLVR